MKEMVPTKPIMALAHDVGLIKNGRCIFKNTIFYLNSINFQFFSGSEGIAFDHRKVSGTLQRGETIPGPFSSN
jgi:hypothetical protein